MNFNKMLYWQTVLLVGIASLLSSSTQVIAEDENMATQVVALVENHVTLSIPERWERVEPRSQMIAHEFSVPAPKEEGEPGRLTIMAAGGTVEANIDRWVGQFQTPTGQPLGKEDKKVSAKDVGEVKVHVVDFRGDFFDQPRGPFGPKTRMPNYRLLGAIVPTPEHGTWFVKFYGPEETVAAAADGFHKMIDEIQVK